VVRQGEVYWLQGDVPEGSEAGYRRPWIVIQNDEANDSGLATTVLAAMTTNLRVADLGGNVEIPAGQGSLARASVVLVSQLETIDRRFLPGPSGIVARHLVRRIAAGIQALVEPVDPV
jgi:mRNA interferase MazF